MESQGARITTLIVLLHQKKLLPYGVSSLVSLAPAPAEAALLTCGQALC